MEDLEKFRKNFIELTDELNCKKSQIHKILGIDYDTCKKIYDYGKVPRTTSLIRIANGLEVSIEYLIGKTKETYYEPSENPSDFWQRYNYLKDKFNLTDYEVAAKLHINSSYTTKWNNGRMPSLDYLITLCEIFNVSLDYLLGRTDYDKPYSTVDNWLE